MSWLATSFWLCLALMLLAYPGYPLLLWLLSRFVSRPVKNGDSLPSLTLLIPAYNEAEILAAKLDNALASDYPRDLQQIIVISDASTDATDEIARSYGDRGVELIVNPQRRGKTFGLNRAVRNARGEILVFTDADAFFEPDTLRRLVRGFADQTVGLVTGSTRYFSSGEAGQVVLSMGLYTRLEQLLKRLESGIASCVGADGAIFALRKNLYRPLDSSDINDLVIPLQALRQGKRVIYDPAVYCREEHQSGLGDEFERQVRISNRTARALLTNLDLLNPFGYGHFAWMLLCHKWLRFLFPMLLLISLLLALAQALGGGWFYPLYLGLVALGLLLPFYFGKAGGRLAGLLQTFTMTNVAILVGWGRVLRNDVSVTWNARKPG